MASSSSPPFFYLEIKMKWGLCHICGVKPAVVEYFMQQKQLCAECAESYEAVACKFCKKEANIQTAHLHQGEYVGECCWDERLRITE